MEHNEKLQLGLLPIITHPHKKSIFDKILYLFLSLIPIGICIVYTPKMIATIGKYLAKNEPVIFICNIVLMSILVIFLIIVN